MDSQPRNGDDDRSIPADVVGVIGFVVIANAVIWLPGIRDTPLRVPVGLALALFVPGYALLAALFPARGDNRSADRRPVEKRAERQRTAGTEPTDGASSLPSRTIDRTERLVLSVVTSAAIVVLAGLVVSASPVGFRFAPVVLAVSAVTVCGMIIATLRRRRLAPGQRYVVSYRERLAGIRSSLTDPDSRTEGVVNGALAVGVILLIGSVLYAITVPAPGYTELALLHQNETGSLVADDYPTEFNAGHERSLIVSIANHEHETTTYTVVIELQRIAITNNSVRTGEVTELDRFRTTVEPNRTHRRRSTIAPTMTGRELRLTYLLYRGQPPANPTIENAYRETHLFVNVTAAGQSTRPVPDRAFVPIADGPSVREPTDQNSAIASR